MAVLEVNTGHPLDTSTVIEDIQRLVGYSRIDLAPVRRGTTIRHDGNRFASQKSPAPTVLSWQDSELWHWSLFIGSINGLAATAAITGL
jgi:hypothetical protein